jgi:hypothetical protein
MTPRKPPFRLGLSSLLWLILLVGHSAWLVLGPDQTEVPWTEHKPTSQCCVTSSRIAKIVRFLLTRGCRPV